MKKLLPLLLLQSVLTGCALAPGITMSEHAEIAAAEGKAEIIAITPELINEYRQQPKAADDTQPEDFDYQPYRIGPRDILTITVWDHPELTIPAGEFRSADISGQLVDEHGNLYYPYVGTIRAAGLTPNELREQLAQRLSKYIANPQLDVRVAAYRSQRVHVVGEVKLPGIQPVNDIPLTVAEAIDRSGGITPNANLRNITLTRNGNAVKLDLLALYERGNAAQNLLLKNGDVLYVPDIAESKVFIMGEVTRPASALMTRGRMTLAEALSLGGVNQTTASGERIYVIRNGEQLPKIFHLNAGSAAALLLADAFELQSRDVVFVDTAGVTRWNRVISQILPSAQLIKAGDDVTR